MFVVRILNRRGSLRELRDQGLRRNATTVFVGGPDQARNDGGASEAADRKGRVSITAGRRDMSGAREAASEGVATAATAATATAASASAMGGGHGGRQRCHRYRRKRGNSEFRNAIHG